MASSQDIETLRGLALSEQYSAAIEGRELDWRMLDSIGETVLALESPVVCMSPVMSYQTYRPTKNDYVIEEINSPGVIGGRFGGFTKTVVEMIDLDGDTVPYQQACYYVLDTNRNDIGCLCPVQNATLYDSIATLEAQQPSEPQPLPEKLDEVDTLKETIFDQITY